MSESEFRKTIDAADVPASCHPKEQCEPIAEQLKPRPQAGLFAFADHLLAAVLVSLIVFPCGCPSSLSEERMATATPVDEKPPRSPSASSEAEAKRMAASENSLGRFASDDFFAAIRLSPGPLWRDPYFASLPVHTFFPQPFSLARLDRLGVKDIAIFCGPKTAKADGTVLNWAAAARMSKPVDLKTLIADWQRSLVPKERTGEVHPVPIEIAGRKCFQISAGSFFPPPRRYADLRFIDRNGKPAEAGVNVGNLYEYRSYVEGGTKAKAIFTLADLDEADLIDGNLPLELQFDVFLTHRLGKEFPIAQVTLRNPKTGTKSEPIRLKGRSLVQHQLRINRKLTVVDGDNKRQGTLFGDLLSDGKLEIVLTCIEEATYVGVGKYDLSLRPRAFEFCCIKDREIIAAQDEKTLNRMLDLSQKRAAFAETLARPGELVIAANLHEEAHRPAFSDLIGRISRRPFFEHLAEHANDATAVLRLQKPSRVQFTARFGNADQARKSRRLQRQLIRDWKEEIATAIPNEIYRGEAMANLISLGMGGAAIRFPEDPELSPERRVRALVQVAGQALDAIEAESENNPLTVSFTPPQPLSQRPKLARYALANWDEASARFLFSRERFDQGDELFQRVTDRFPNEPGAWFRRAHQLTYNVPIEFTGYEAQYAWIRRGFHVLLDGLEKNPGNVELLWTMARFIGHKVGSADNRDAYRELFSKDEELHSRFEKHVDLDKSKSADQDVDNWLVAKQFFELAIEQFSRDQNTVGIHPVILHSRPAETQARFAGALAENGHAEAAKTAWKDAQRMFEELGRSEIPLGKSRTIRLADLPMQLEKRGPDDPVVKRLQVWRKLIHYDQWLGRCRYEQQGDVLKARRLASEAKQQVQNREAKSALARFHQSLEILAELQKSNEEDFLRHAGEFRDIAEDYRRFARSSSALETLEESLSSLLDVIESAKTWSDYPPGFGYDLQPDKGGFDDIPQIKFLLPYDTN